MIQSRRANHEINLISKANLKNQGKTKTKKKKDYEVKKLKRGPVPDGYNWLNVFQQKNTFVKEDLLSQRSNNFGRVNFKSENMIYRKCSFL